MKPYSANNINSDVDDHRSLLYNEKCTAAPARRHHPTTPRWTRIRSQMLMLLLPRNRRRLSVYLVAYVFVLSLISYWLMARFSTCLFCQLETKKDDLPTQDISDKEELNKILQQLRQRVVKIANLSEDLTTSPQQDSGKTERPVEVTTKLSLDPKVEAAIGVLEALADKPFDDVAEEYEKASLHFYGMQTRLDHILMKLLFLDDDDKGFQKRRQLRVAAVGGSITVGNAIPRGDAYFNHFERWLSEDLAPHGIDLVFHNAAIGASGSEYFSMCIQEYFNMSDIDILLVEFAFNDGRYAYYMSGYMPEGGRPLEELVRAVWRQNPFIHIVLINFPFIKNIFTLYYPPKCESIEDELHLNVARHYQLSSVRWKHLFCSANASMTRNEQTELAKIYVASDGNHPSVLIHQQMAEFLIFYFKTAFRHLTERLQIARGASTVGAMIIADRFTILEHASRLVKVSPPIFKSTWLDAADCFAAFNRPFRVNMRLKKSLVAASADVSLDEVFTIGVYERDGIEYADDLQLFILEKPASYVIFRLDKLASTSPCGGRVGFEPRLALAYTLCKDCSPGELAIFASFYMADGAVHNATMKVKLKAFGFRTNYVHSLPALSQLIAPSSSSSSSLSKSAEERRGESANSTQVSMENQMQSRFCQLNEQPFISSIVIRIDQMSQNYPLLLHAITVNYDCCDNNLLRRQTQSNNKRF